MSRATLLDRKTVRSIFQLLEDPELSTKEFAQACNSNPYYLQVFGSPGSIHRERCRSFHKRRRDERKNQTERYIKKCIAQGVKVNPFDRRVYNIYLRHYLPPQEQQEESTIMPPPAQFSSPPPNEIHVDSPSSAPDPHEQSVATKYYQMALRDTSMNWPGVRMATVCPNGVVAVVLWSDVNLDRLKVSVDKEGWRVWGNKDIPDIESSSLLFPQYAAWNRNSNDIIIAHMQKALDDVNKIIKNEVPDKKDRVPLITFKEPVSSEFVRPDGRPGGEIKWQRSNDGRIVINFFLKTKADRVGTYASEESNDEADPVLEAQRRLEETIQAQRAALEHAENNRAADARAYREEMQAMQEDANRRHQEAMAAQHHSMQMEMAKMQHQFEQMMMAAAAAATGQQGPPPPVPTSQSEEWMDPVDISGPVPDGAGSS